MKKLYIMLTLLCLSHTLKPGIYIKIGALSNISSQNVLIGEILISPESIYLGEDHDYVRLDEQEGIVALCTLHLPHDTMTFYSEKIGSCIRLITEIRNNDSHETSRTQIHEQDIEENVDVYLTYDATFEANNPEDINDDCIQVIETISKSPTS
jgi:hypothetical protein